MNPLLEPDYAPNGAEPTGLLAMLKVPEFKRGLMALLQDPRNAAKLGMVQGVVTGAMLPGDAYQGKVDPLSDEGLDRARQLTGLAVTGGLAGHARPTPRVPMEGISEAESQSGGLLDFLSDPRKMARLVGSYGKNPNAPQPVDPRIRRQDPVALAIRG